MDEKKAAVEDGGPAFPIHFNTAIDRGMAGISARDYFAAKAMQAFLAKIDLEFGQEADEECFALQDTLAATAYSMADAMLAARKVAA